MADKPTQHDVNPQQPVWHPYAIGLVVAFLVAWVGWVTGWCSEAGWQRWHHDAPGMAVAAIVSALVAMVPYAVLLAINDRRHWPGILLLIVGVVFLATFLLSGMLFVAMGV